MHGRVWINFKELREKLKFEDVLRLYNVEVKRSGAQHQGPCPLPLHTGPKGPTAFSANLDRGIFQCFGCKAKGNLLDFACFMEKANPADGNSLRKVAIKLQEALLPKGKEKQPRATDKPARLEKAHVHKILVNEPLDFELKDLDAEHPYLIDHCCLIPETIQHFGLGLCSRGFLKGRIAIPLHDGNACLIGYAGLLVDGAEEITEASPILFPQQRERNGVVLAFDKTLFVYNGCQITRHIDAMIVVDDFRTVWWLHQNGFGNVVSMMGHECSDAQAGFLMDKLKPQGRIWVISAERQLAESSFARTRGSRFVRWVQLEPNQAATDLTGNEIEARLCL